MVNNNLTTTPGCDHRKPMGDRFQLRNGKSIRKGRQNEDIRFSK